MKNASRQFMQMAIDKAREGIKQGQTPFAACIVLNGIPLVCNHNMVFNTTDITAHAEIYAIRNACLKTNSIFLDECEIYSTTEPCPMCFTAIHWAKVKKIVYGTSIKEAQQFGFNELAISNQQMKKLGQTNIEIIEGFMKDECSQLFIEWSKLPSKKSY